MIDLCFVFITLLVLLTGKYLHLLLKQRKYKKELVVMSRRINQRKDFVANVSHELRTPITLIKGFTETLLDGAKDSPKDLDLFLNKIKTHSDRLNEIIEDLLNLSKIETEEDAHQIDFFERRLKGPLENAIADCQPKADKKNISILIDYKTELLIKINPHLIEQALINLIENAIKYSPKNSQVICKIEDTKNGEVMIKVSDKGPGIPKEHLPHLFQRFYRVDKGRSRKLGGTGLGLAIVKNIAQAHHGRVDVKSEVGIGSDFFIYLK